MTPSDFQAPTATDHEVPPAPTHWRMAEHWPELVVALTDQSIESVSLLLRGLDLLVQRGRISADEYKVLALPADRLRQCGMSAQQIVRFQSGRVRQSHEKIDLVYLVESVLQERRNELALQGITVRRRFKPADVLIDPTLGHSLTQAMLEWSMPYGNRMELRLDPTQDLPPRARLSMKTLTSRDVTPAAVLEDNIRWLLLRQIAATDGGIDVERALLDDGVELSAVFKRTMGNASPEADPVDSEPGFLSVSGAFVLVCAAKPSIRREAVEVLRRKGLEVEGVASAAQAVHTLQGREVHLLVLDLEHPPVDVVDLQQELSQSHPLLPVVGIGPVGSGTPRGGDQPTVASDTLQASLGDAVMHTLAKVM